MRSDGWTAKLQGSPSRKGEPKTGISPSLFPGPWSHPAQAWHSPSGFSVSQTIPYSTAIPGGLRPHTWVKMKGSVSVPEAGSRLSPCRLHSSFRVKFIYGQYEGANVALLFNPRFEGSPHIIFNSLVARKWGQEERKENSPLRRGKSFTLTFTTTAKAYEVGRRHHYAFQHRLPPEHVRFLEMDGDVNLTVPQLVFSRSNYSWGNSVPNN
uniref:Galectin n=1 Tax=Chelonoidis abingdonii TaxID=106734 RepID=A0A8C0GLY1_CHEAB